MRIMERTYFPIFDPMIIRDPNQQETKQGHKKIG